MITVITIVVAVVIVVVVVVIIIITMVTGSNVGFMDSCNKDVLHLCF